MLWVLLPLMAGVICSDVLQVGLLCAWVSFIVAVAIFLVFRYTQLIYAVIFAFALLVACPDDTPSVEPLGRAREFAIRPLSGYSGEVLAYREAGSPWRESGVELYVWAGDVELSQDSVFVCTGRVTPSAEHFDNYSSRLYIEAVDYSMSLAQSGINMSLAQRLQRWATQRLERLELNDEVHGAAMALVLGRREHLSDHVVESYRLSGTSHLLALSGLHITVVFLFISLLLYYLPLLSRGHIISAIVSIILIWLFALMSGLGVSVVRAATMFTLLRVSWLASAHYDSINSLLSAAVIILIFDCAALYDVGFQLSFISVLGIMLWSKPIYRLVHSPSRIINWLASSLIMGVVATVATAPLVSYYFGAFSWLSPLTTLPLLFTLALVVLFTLVWIMMPLPFLAPLVREIITMSATVQNYIVERVALFKPQLIEYQATWVDVVGAYLIYIIVTIFIYRERCKAAKF